MTTKVISAQLLILSRLNTLWLWGLSLVIITIGISSILGWVLEIPALTTWQPNTRPSSPMTAVLSILFGSVLGLFIRQPLSQPPTILLKGTGVITALLFFLLRLNHIYPTLELLGLPITGTVNNVPIGYISLITAFCFFWAFLSLFILRNH